MDLCWVYCGNFACLLVGCVASLLCFGLVVYFGVLVLLLYDVVSLFVALLEFGVN